MRLPLEVKESECLKLIYSDKLSAEESSELVIPDTYPDVGRILDVRGQTFLVSKKAITEGVAISATVDVNVLFAAEEGEAPHSVGTRLSFEFSAIAKGADEDSFVTAALEMLKLEARMLNPRKLLIRAEVSASVNCYKKDSFTIWNDLQQTEEAGVHLLKKELEHSLVMSIAEKSFTVSEEYEIPGGSPGAELISCVTDIFIDDVKSVGNKLVFKATTRTTAVFLGGDNEVFSSVFESQFSQIIESDNASDEPEVDIIISLAAADFVMLPDREEGVIAANFKIGVQAVCVLNMTSTFVADAYSNRVPLEILSEQVPVMCCEAPKRQKLRLEGSIGEEQVSVVFLHSVGISFETDGGKISFTARASGIGRKESGELMPLSITLRGNDDVMLEVNQRVMISGVSCGIISTNHGGGAFVDLFYNQTIMSSRELQAICALEADMESPADNDARPSMVVLCGNKGASLWDIAKKFGSTIEMIKGANSMCGEFSENTRPLIVPKV